MRHIKKVLSYSIAGSLGLAVVASLHGCSDSTPPNQGVSGFDGGPSDSIDQSWFLVLEQTGIQPDTYKLVEKHPTSGPTRAILRMPDGSERFMSEDELKQVAAEEAARVESGTSRLTEDPSTHAGGLSLGETLVAAAAGAMIGGMLANRLAGNGNFQRTQKSYGGGRPTASISQPASSRTKSTGSQPRSGFFGGNNARSSSSGSSRSFGG